MNCPRCNEEITVEKVRSPINNCIDAYILWCGCSDLNRNTPPKMSPPIYKRSEASFFSRKDEEQYIEGLKRDYVEAIRDVFNLK